MLKSIVEIATILTKSEQKKIIGKMGSSMGDCFIPEPGCPTPGPFEPPCEPVLIGHAPCDGVSVCRRTGLPPFCYAF